MALLVPDVGEAYLLAAFVAKQPAAVPVLKLYQNNITPAETDTDVTYTVATFTGYSNISMSAGGSWTVSGTAPTMISYAQQTFTSSANQATQQIYGYYVTATGVNTLLWAERFSDGPYPITNNGDQIKITPQITAD